MSIQPHDIPTIQIAASISCIIGTLAAIGFQAFVWRRPKSTGDKRVLFRRYPGSLLTFTVAMTGCLAFTWGVMPLFTGWSSGSDFATCYSWTVTNVFFGLLVSVSWLINTLNLYLMVVKMRFTFNSNRSLLKKIIIFYATIITACMVVIFVGGESLLIYNTPETNTNCQLVPAIRTGFLSPFHGINMLIGLFCTYKILRAYFTTRREASQDVDPVFVLKISGIYLCYALPIAIFSVAGVVWSDSLVLEFAFHVMIGGNSALSAGIMLFRRESWVKVSIGGKRLLRSMSSKILARVSSSSSITRTNSDSELDISIVVDETLA